MMRILFFSIIYFIEQVFFFFQKNWLVIIYKIPSIFKIAHKLHSYHFPPILLGNF